MKKIIVTWTIIFCLILVAGCMKNATSAQEYQFGSKDEVLPESKLLVHNEKLDTKIISQEISFSNNFFCKNGQEAKKVEFYSKPQSGVDGDLDSRYAISCGNTYYIVQWHTSFGQKIYGPFKK